ncbi:hypothetical protein PLESTB_000446700 [Pleodorina starrii]|uniref:Uncharacterized protein n=1 Tax=Pleodorina starrii TaxID=330485 RepID=A0A9W6BFQ7_9CHLO|nr:hypothetical protein PLESTB_000446700 [Pleodorina starrii]GLC69885.1 hypothetical protein PLESTF_000891400 [Pleodorina starrii]
MEPTINCWTMILACVGSIIGTVYVSITALNPGAIPIFALFTSTTVLHLPFCVGFHLFTSMRRPVFNKWRKMDVIGIFNVSILLAFSLSYFVFPWWGCLANTLVAACVALTATVSFAKTPDEVDLLDPGKQALFVGTVVLCYWFPMACATVRDTLDGKFTLSSGATVGVFVGLSLSGWAFSTAWPQRHFPGRFDVWGHSHQLMHVGVLICHALEFAFLWDNWKRWYSCK